MESTWVKSEERKEEEGEREMSGLVEETDKERERDGKEEGHGEADDVIDSSLLTFLTPSQID